LKVGFWLKYRLFLEIIFAIALYFALFFLLACLFPHYLRCFFLPATAHEHLAALTESLGVFEHPYE
jgi:hypothetical protein